LEGEFLVGDLEFSGALGLFLVLKGEFLDEDLELDD
jgi:hypothetical protein